MDNLNKMVYLGHRRFLLATDELQNDTDSFPHMEEFLRASWCPIQLSIRSPCWLMNEEQEQMSGESARMTGILNQIRKANKFRGGGDG